MKSIVSYPRGFYGFYVGVLPLSPNAPSLVSLIRSIQYNRPTQANSTNGPGNPNIDKLHQEHSTGVAYTSKFTFRERILVEALKAFGTTSFLEWVNLQLENPSIGDMHKRFMLDTFQFINTGKRSMAVSTWSTLVLPAKGQLLDAKSFGVIDFFRTDCNPDFQRNSSLIAILQDWTSQPDGFDDLLGSLNIWFGSVN